jgi:hypothetical protein
VRRVARPGAALLISVRRAHEDALAALGDALGGVAGFMHEAELRRGWLLSDGAEGEHRSVGELREVGVRLQQLGRREAQKVARKVCGCMASLLHHSCAHRSSRTPRRATSEASRRGRPGGVRAADNECCNPTCTTGRMQSRQATVLFHGKHPTNADLISTK